MKYFILFCCFVMAVQGSDLITSLPGLKKLPIFKQYSGYLDASNQKHFHYWFVESQSNPQEDPVVLWLNGGPGCSSLDGLLSENGPLQVNDDGNTLRTNPYSWNKIANILYLESPAGVGYSYDDSGNTKTDDDEVADNNYNSLISFFKKYPQFSSNPFFITGESYGGVYLPTLALKILEGGTFNFQGMAVGNGLSSYQLNTNSLIFFAYYHGLFGIELWNPMMKYCCNNNVTIDGCDFDNSTNPNCQDLVEEAKQYVYHSGLNSYALYRDCYGGDDLEGSSKRYIFDMKMLFPKRTISQLVKTKLKQPKLVGMSPDCINSTASTNWLNRLDVRGALHIPNHLRSWTVCSDDVNMNYGRKYTDMSGVYEKILSNNLRVLIYNGDTDMACNFMGDEWFVDKLSSIKQTRSRAPWLVQGQVAGFAKTYRSIKSSSTLVYTTIRGAGHMVPQWAPKKAYQMFEKFLKNQSF